MATDLHELTGGVVYESGQVLNNQEALRFLSESVLTFNADAPTEFTLTAAPGVDHAYILDRDATAQEKRVLILMATLMWITGESRKYSFEAIKHSNPAGATAMDGIEFALSKRAKDLRDELTVRLASLGDGSGNVLAGGGTVELGETLHVPWMPPVGPWSGWRWGW